MPKTFKTALQSGVSHMLQPVTGEKSENKFTQEKLKQNQQEQALLRYCRMH